MTYVVNKREWSFRAFAEETQARLFCVEVLIGEVSDGATPEDYAVLANQPDSDETTAFIETGKSKHAQSLIEFVNDSKNFRVVKQECEKCGKQFNVVYTFSKTKGVNYAYVGDTCECEGAGFSPIDGELSLSQFGKKAGNVRYETNCDSCEDAKKCKKLMRTLLGACATAYFPSARCDFV